MIGLAIVVMGWLSGSVIAQDSGVTRTPTPLPSLVSNYLQAIIGYTGFAAGAVQCGLRSREWGANFHDRVIDLVKTHAGSPVPDFTPDGRMKSSAHVPSAAEQDAALAAIQRKELEGVSSATQAHANAGEPTSYCKIIVNMALSQLDDYVTDAASLWPSIQ